MTKTASVVKSSTSQAVKEPHSVLRDICMTVSSPNKPARSSSTSESPTGRRASSGRSRWPPPRAALQCQPPIVVSPGPMQVSPQLRGRHVESVVEHPKTESHRRKATNSCNQSSQMPNAISFPPYAAQDMHTAPLAQLSVWSPI